MRIYRQNNAEHMILKVLLAVALSSLVCFGQGVSPASSTHRPLAQNTPQGQATSSGSPDKVVLTVGSTKVTQGDMDYLINNLNAQAKQVIAARGRAPVGEQYMLMLLLSQKATDEHLDALPEFQRQLGLQKTQMLAQEEYANIQKSITVTPDEINNYYNAHKSDFEQVKLREIVVRSKAEDAKPDDPGLTPADAKSRLDSIQKALTAGTDPTKVAGQFGIPNVVMVEEQPRNVHRGELLPALDKAAFEVKDNQFSDPIAISQALVVLQVLGHSQPDVKDVSSDIESNLRQQKLNSAVNDLKSKTKTWMDPDYFKAPAAAASGTNQPAQGGLPPR